MGDVYLYATKTVTDNVTRTDFGGKGAFELSERQLNAVDRRTEVGQTTRWERHGDELEEVTE